MKKHRFHHTFIVVVALFAFVSQIGVAWGQTKSDEFPTKFENISINNSYLVMKDGFGAQFWVTDNDRFFLNWIQSDIKNLTSVTATRRNRTLYTAIFFVDPGVGLNGVSDVSYDLQVLKPDGVDYGGAKNIAGWVGRPPEPHLVQLASGRISIIFEVIDPPGTYTLKLLVRDNIRKVAIPLERKIILRE